MSRADLIDTDPITLAEASEILLRGIVSRGTLYAEYQKGNLVCERIGKNLFTTPAAIREMRERCRVNQARPASTSDQTTAPGSSATGARTTELAALKASVQMLKSGYLTTLRKSTSPSPQSAGKVTQFTSKK